MNKKHKSTVQPQTLSNRPWRQGQSSEAGSGGVAAIANALAMKAHRQKLCDQQQSAKNDLLSRVILTFGGDPDESDASDEGEFVVDMPSLVVSQQQTIMFQQTSISKLLKEVERLNETVANLEGEIREVDEFMDLLDDQNCEMAKLHNYIGELEAKAS